MSVTATYSRTRRAFRAAAASAEVDPFDVRVLVALYESVEPSVDELALADLLVVRIEAIRRSTRKLDEAGLVERTSTGRGGRPTRARLTAGGMLVAREALAKAGC